MMVRKEVLPDGIYDAPPDSIKVEYAMLRCRSCDAMSEWSEVPLDHDHGLAEETWSWEFDHEKRTQHRHYFAIRVERNAVDFIK